MKITKAIAPVVCSMSSFVLMASTVSAATSEFLDNADLQGTGDTNLMSWVSRVLNIVIGLAALVSAAMLIFSGYKYITANGDEAAIGKATKSLTWAIVGLVICFISVLIVNFVMSDVIK